MTNPHINIDRQIVGDSGRDYGHTYYDTVDKVDQTDLRDAASLAARIAMRVAKEKDWPVKERDEKAVLKLMDSPAMKEIQEIRERIDAISLV